MGHRNDYEGEFYADRMNNIYKVIADSEITEFRDGHPFSYPACVLEQVAGSEKGKNITIGKSYMDSVLNRAVMPKLADDSMENLKTCLEEFNDALGMANKNEYFNDKGKQETMATAANVLAESYLNRGFRPSNPDEYCHKQTVKFLENYTTYILSHMEVVTMMKKKREEDENRTSNKTEV